MKNKGYLIVVLPLIPGGIVLFSMTKGFLADSFQPPALIITTLVILFSMLYIWHRFVSEPASDLLRSINRAIQGDYRARFSCGKENEMFYQLSQRFNQLMTIVEKQTNELVHNRHLQNQLYENEKIYRSALELTCERLFEVDLTHNKLIYGQDTYNRVFPFLRTAIYDEMIKQIAENAIHEDDMEAFKKTFSRQNLTSVFSSGETTQVNLEYRQISEDKQPTWMEATLIHLSNHSDNHLEVIGYVKNINERKQHELQILNQSQKDGLTGLYNKLFTQSLIEEYLAGEGEKSQHAAIMLDVDNFKSINDTLGHIEGDYTLAQVAEKLKSLFRASDIVGRIGGDEFFILLKEYHSLDSLKEKLNTLRNAFQEIHLGKDGYYSITGSIGVSLYPRDGRTYTELYQMADTALYHSKEHGKNRYSICGSFIETGSQKGVHLLTELDEARNAKKIN